MSGEHVVLGTPHHGLQLELMTQSTIYSVLLAPKSSQVKRHTREYKNGHVSMASTTEKWLAGTVTATSVVKSVSIFYPIPSHDHQPS